MIANRGILRHGSWQAHGGTFANSFVINAGSGDNVEKGQAVLNDQGFVGRVSVVAKHSARVLLANDINSRVPIIIENTRTRGILAGGNTQSGQSLLSICRPTPTYFIANAWLRLGMGAMFPPGLPVGVVASVNDGGVEVKLFADYHKMEFVRVADYGLSCRYVGGDTECRGESRKTPMSETFWQRLDKAARSITPFGLTLFSLY